MKTNTIKKERLRKRYVTYTRKPKAVSDRKALARWYYGADCQMVRHPARLGHPDAAGHEGKSPRPAGDRVLGTPDQSQRRSDECPECGTDVRDALTFARSLLEDKDVMVYIFRHSKQRRQYLDFATVRGHPMPVHAVPMESWRIHASTPAFKQRYSGMDVYRGRWTEARINAYIESLQQTG